MPPISACYWRIFSCSFYSSHFFLCTQWAEHLTLAMTSCTKLKMEILYCLQLNFTSLHSMSANNVQAFGLHSIRCVLCLIKILPSKWSVECVQCIMHIRVKSCNIVVHNKYCMVNIRKKERKTRSNCVNASKMYSILPKEKQKTRTQE